MIFRSLIALAVIVSTGWFLVWGVVKKQWRSTWWGLALLILVSVGLGLKSMTEMHLRYLEFLLPVLALWIPYLGYRLWRRYSRAKLIVGVLLFIVLSAQLYTVIVYFWENSRGVVDEPYIELPYVALSQAVDWMAVDAQGPFEIDATPIVGYPDAFQWVAEAHGYSFPAGSPTVIYRLVRADQQEKYTEPSWGRFISEAVVSSIVIKKYERIQEETK
jgi:hypothetical protein